MSLCLKQRTVHSVHPLCVNTDWCVKQMVLLRAVKLVQRPQLNKANLSSNRAVDMELLAAGLMNSERMCSKNYKNKKAVLSQRWPRNAPICDLYMDALKFSGFPDYAHRYYSQHFSWAFVPIEAINVRTKFEVRSSTRSWDNRGYPKNLSTPWIRPRSLSPKFLMGFYSDWPCKSTRQIWSP